MSIAPKNFRTTFQVEPPKFKISYADKIMLVGSCFSENIGKKLLDYKFQTLINPFGILFNPISVADSLLRILNQEKFKEEELHFHNDLWYSFSHHGKFSNASKSQTLTTINDSLLRAHIFLFESKFLIITLGTAWVYEHIASEKIVANCHKIPQKAFKKLLLTPEKIIEQFEKLQAAFTGNDLNINVIFTVSPVRHSKDGFIENQLSKSILHLAIHQYIKKNVSAYYFPAYELMMDDLRDYRFYAEDMIHPNAQAIDYIWDIFKDAVISTEDVKIMMQIQEILKAIQHKPHHPHSEKYEDFCKAYIGKLQHIRKKFPFLDLNEENQFFQDKINQV